MFFNDLNKPLLILCNSDPYSTAFFCKLQRRHFFGSWGFSIDSLMSKVTWGQTSLKLNVTNRLAYWISLGIKHPWGQLSIEVKHLQGLHFGSNVSSKAEIKHLFFWSMVLGLMFQSNAMRSIVFAIIGDIVKKLHIFIKHANHYFTIQTDWIPCWKTFNLSTLV